jgi:hypothetical protein
VVDPVTVTVAGKQCLLTPDDYITRTGGLNGDATVNVQVKASRPSDCRQGAATAVTLNDLMAMENDQQQRIMDGMQLASQSMGKNGMPAGPAAAPTAVPAGKAVADQNLADALQQSQSEAESDANSAAGRAGTGY